MDFFLHIGEVIVIKESSSILLYIIGPNRCLCKRTTSAVSERIKNLDEFLKVVSGGDSIGVGKIVVGNLRGKHVSFIPPGLCEQKQTKE